MGDAARALWLFALGSLAAGCYLSHGRGEPVERDAGDRTRSDAGPTRADGGPPAPDAGLDAGTDAGLDAGPRVPIDSGPPPPIPAECAAGAVVPDPAPPQCSLDLEVLAVTRSTPSCFVDEMVEGARGTLRYTCGGGRAVLVLNGRRFSGEVVDGSVAVCLGTTFSWVDGCDWISAQQIYGDLRSSELTFVYREMPEPPGPCASPCGASARVRVR